VTWDTQRDKHCILIGRISGVYGVHGWVRVHSYTEPREEVLRYVPWYLNYEGKWLAQWLRQGYSHGKGIVVALEGINDRTTAARWIGCDIAIHREQLPAINTGEYYWADLVGLEVVTEQGITFGRVEPLLAPRATHVLVVRGERARLIPFLRGAVIKQVDLKQGTLTVDWDSDF